MKKLIAFLLACCLFGAANIAYAAEAAPGTGSTAAATVAQPDTLPAEYAVIRRPEGDGSHFQRFTNAADVKKIKALLPDYDGGKVVDKQLTGSPIKVRYAIGTNAYAYEIYPDDLIVWWYDMKCATVKGAYAALDGMMNSAPALTNAPQIEAREYGAGENFMRYYYFTGNASVKPFLDALKTMTPVEAPETPWPGGGLSLSVILIEGLENTAYYFLPSGYVQNQSSGELYRMKPGSLDLVWEQMNVYTTQPSPSVLLTWWPESQANESNRLFYTRSYLNSQPQTSGSTKNAVTYEQILAVLDKRKAMNAPAEVPATTPLIASVLEKGKFTARYLVYEDGAAHDTEADKWYTLPENAFETLLEYYKTV